MWVQECSSASFLRKTFSFCAISRCQQRILAAPASTRTYTTQGGKLRCRQEARIRVGKIFVIAVVSRTLGASVQVIGQARAVEKVVCGARRVEVSTLR